MDPPGSDATTKPCVILRGLRSEGGWRRRLLFLYTKKEYNNKMNQEYGSDRLLQLATWYWQEVIVQISYCPVLCRVLGGDVTLQGKRSRVGPRGRTAINEGENTSTHEHTGTSAWYAASYFVPHVFNINHIAARYSNAPQGITPRRTAPHGVAMPAAEIWYELSWAKFCYSEM